MDGRLLHCELTGQVAKFSPRSPNRSSNGIQPLLGLFRAQGQIALSLFHSRPGSGIHCLACAGQRVALMVDQLFDVQREFHLAAAI